MTTKIETENGLVDLTKFARYKPDQHPDYWTGLIHSAQDSVVLNPSKSTHHSHVNLANAPSVRQRIRVLEDLIADLELDRDDIRKDKKRYERRHQNRGLLLTDGWERRFDKKRLTVETQIDFKKIEVSELKEILKEQEERQAKVLKRDHASQVLKYGPQNRRRTGRVERYFEDGEERERRFDEVDGQNTSFIEGILCIDDEASPYDGMPVISYHQHIVRPFIAKKQNREKAYQKALQEWAANGSIPNQRPANPKKLTREDWPKWPPKVKNFKAKKQPKTESVRESTLIRTT